MRRSAFKMFHIVSRVANEEAQISADLTRWPFVASAAGNFQPAHKHTIVRGVPLFSIAFSFPVKAFTPLTCTGIERSVMQRSLLPIKLPEDRTATLQYGTCAREALVHIASETSCLPWRIEGIRYEKLERRSTYKLQFIALVNAYSLSSSPRITSITTIHFCNAERYRSVRTYWRLLSNECCHW